MSLLNTGIIWALEKTGLDDFIILIPIYVTSDNLLVLFHDLVFYTDVFYYIQLQACISGYIQTQTCFLSLFFSNLKQQFFYSHKSSI